MHPADTNHAFAAALGKAVGVRSAEASAEIASAEEAIGAFDVTLPPTDPDAAAAYAVGARFVSMIQGLPDGTYDFTRITPRQMTIAGGALIAAGTASSSGLAAVLDLAEQARATDSPVNFFAYLHQQSAENAKSPGGMDLAFRQKSSIAVLQSLQNQWDVPIRYDDEYPTAPHNPTTEEVGAKMTAAIAAFTKEASLTPAQRIRRDVLKDMKITEEKLKAMSPTDREAAEKTIGEEVRRRLEMLGLDHERATDAAADRKEVTSLSAG